MARVEYEVKAMLSAIDRGWSQGFKKASEDVSTFDAKTQNILDGASTAVGKTMSAVSTALGAGLLGFGTWGLGVGIEFNKTMSEVEALTQESSEELLGLLKAQALEIGEQTKFSANEVAQGYAEMAQAGFDVQELLASMPGVTNLAAAANTNLAEASQMAAVAINTFGLDPSETDRVSDVYAQVASVTNASLLSMKDSMSLVGPDARALGYDIEEVSAAIGVLGDMGLVGSRAGTGLRQVFNSMRNPTAKSLKSQDTLGISFWDEDTGKAKDLIEILGDLENAFEGLSPKDKAGHLAAMFNVRGSTAINALLNATSEDLDQLTESLYNADGAAQQMAETMQDNLAGDIEKAGGAFESTGVIISDMFDGPLRRFFQGVEANVEDMNRWLKNFANLENNTERFWIALMEVSDVLPTIGAGLGVLGAVRIAPGLNNFLGQFANLGKKKWATMIDPLTGDTVKYQQEVTKLGQFFQNVGQKAQTAFTQAGAKLSNFGGKLATIPDAISSFAGKLTFIPDAFRNWGESLKNSNIFQLLADTVQEDLGIDLSGIRDNISDAMSGMRESISDAMSPITQTLTNLRDKFGSFLSSDLFAKAKGVLGTGFSALKTATEVGFKGVSKSVQLGGDLVQKTSQAIFKVAQIGLKSIGPTILVGALLAGAGILYEKFGEQIDSFVKLAVEKGPGIITGFIDSITPRIQELIGFGADLLVSIADVIVANLPAIVYAGMEIITALANGVMDNMDKIMQSIVRIITVILTTLITAIPDLIILGMDILMSLVQGIIDNLDLIISSVILVIETLVNALIENLPTIIIMGIEVLLGLIQGIVKALPKLMPAIVQAIVTIIETLVDNLDLLIEGGITLMLALIFGIIEALPVIMESAGDIIVALIKGIVEAIPKLLLAGAQLVISLIFGIAEALPELWTAGVDLVTTIWNGVWEGLQSFISNIGNAFGSIWDWLTSGFEGGFEGLWDNITNSTDEAGNAVTDSMTETSEEMIGIVEGTNEAVSTDYVDHLKGMGFTTDAELDGITRKWEAGFDEIDGKTNETNHRVHDRYVENLNSMEMSTDPHLEGMGTSWKTGMDKIEVTAEESNENIHDNHLNLLKDLGIATDNELDNMDGLWDAGYSDIEDTIGGYQSSITGSTGDNYVQLNQETAGAVEEISEKFETGFSNINTNTSGFVSQMSEAFEAMFDNIRTTVDKGVTDLRTSIEEGLTKANTNAQTLLDTLIQTFKVAGGKFYTRGIEAGESYNRGLGQREYMITKTVSKIVTEMVETMTIGDNIKKAGRVTAENYNGVLIEKTPVITATARKIANSIVSELSIYSTMMSNGSSAGQGFYNGLNSWSSRLASKAKSMANSIVRETKRALDINSPSGVMETIGEQTAEGQMVGQENLYKDVVKQARRMANAMVGEPDKTYSSGLGGTYGGALDEVGHERQPVTLLVEMGGRAYRAFVQDIYNENDQNLRIEEVYGG